MKLKVINLAKFKKSKKVLSRAKDTKNFSCGFVVLKKGEDVGEHTTEEKEEIIIVLQGEVEVYIEGKKYKKLKSGNLVYIPQNVVHNVKNNTSKVAKYLYITTC